MGVMENEKYMYEVPPIKQGEIFVPEKEVREILKFKGEERKEKLAIFKEKLNFQKAGLAKAQKEIIEKIQENPDSSYKELFEEVCRLGEEYGMNEEQKKIASSAIEQYEEKHRVIEEMRESYPDANDLYKELFGKKPKGEVEVLVGPAVLYIKCHNLEDYEHLYFVGEKYFNPRKKFDAEFKKWADETKGIQLSGVEKFPDLWIAGENVTKVSEQKNPEHESESVFVHEEQHSLFSLFGEQFERNKAFENHLMEKFRESKNQEEKTTALKNHFRFTRKEAEMDAKDEILAYYKDGTDFSEIAQKLYEEYDFLKEKRENKFLPQWMTKNEEDKTLSEKIARQVYNTEYYELLEDSVIAIKKMETAGYEKEEIIALLTHEPLAKWGKVAGRVLEK
jgi:hypothetical protein